MAKMLTVDSDGHILEPLDLWERYLEPQYRDRAIRRRVNEKGYEYLEFDREPMFLPAGTMGGSAGQTHARSDRSRRAGAGDGRTGNYRRAQGPGG